MESSNAELLRRASDPSQTTLGRIAALKAITDDAADDIVAGVQTIVENETEIDDVAYAAGQTLGRLMWARGRFDDIFWADFSRAGHIGYFEAGADLHRKDPNARQQID